MTSFDQALTLAYDRITANHGPDRADRLAVAVAGLPADVRGNFEHAADRTSLNSMAWMLEHGAVEF